mgnify:CR=1 FL=1
MAAMAKNIGFVASPAVKAKRARVAIAEDVAMPAIAAPIVLFQSTLPRGERPRW